MSARAAIATYLLDHQGEDVFTLGEGVIAALECAGFLVVPMLAPDCCPHCIDATDCSHVPICNAVHGPTGKQTP